ncbi:putative DMT superfamily transporter inner membrane protein [Halalkalicoccus paucihalophilus]|uniref:Putative DMT superfamily transporter inner membrane protein n=1 Tax=Halalkalicoccus paucihalophilus TaxID=1008153 RepID=A0A151AJD9_9EURY|nr:DMT family transporter [Halalkalicoccus paucihalophilus]KYH27630.1 putative DMT superfamily transporter inner membrane protein [Halalkalicoccus paucihalophilus]
MQLENIYKFRNVGLFAVVALVWGASFPAINIGLESLPPVLFAAFRYDIAALLLFGYVAYTGAAWRPTTYDDWLLIGLGGVLLVGAHFALLFTGQQYVTGGVASIVLSLTPVMTPVFALALLPNQRLGLTGVAGLALGLLGVGIIAQPSPEALAGGQLYGVGLLVLSATSFALGAVLTVRMRTTLPMLSLQAWMMGVGALSLHLTSALHPAESFGAIEWTATGVGAVLFLAVFASAIGYLAYFDLQERVGPIETSLVSYATPVVATASGWALLGEPVTDATLLGFAVIAFGFWLCKWSTFTWKVTGLTGRIRHRRASRSPDLVVVGTSVYYRD